MQINTHAGNTLLFLKDHFVNKNKIAALEDIAGVQNANMSIYFNRYVAHLINTNINRSATGFEKIMYFIAKINLPSKLNNLILTPNALEKTKFFFWLIDWVIYNKNVILKECELNSLTVRCFFDSVIKHIKENTDSNRLKNLDLMCLFRSCSLASRNKWLGIETKLTSNFDLDFKTLFEIHSEHRAIEFYTIRLFDKLKCNVGLYEAHGLRGPYLRKGNDVIQANFYEVDNVISRFWYEAYLLMSENDLLNSPPFRIFERYNKFADNEVLRNYTLKISPLFKNTGV